MNILGFTGTRKGMTAFQKAAFIELIRTIKFDVLLHGDCIGADAQAHEFVRILKRNVWIETYPAITSSSLRANCVADVIYPPIAPLRRNIIMVQRAHAIIAAPYELEEIRRSGTWATIRYARMRGVYVYMLWPKEKPP